MESELPKIEVMPTSALSRGSLYDRLTAKLTVREFLLVVGIITISAAYFINTQIKHDQSNAQRFKNQLRSWDRQYLGDWIGMEIDLDQDFFLLFQNVKTHEKDKRYKLVANLPPDRSLLLKFAYQEISHDNYPQPAETYLLPAVGSLGQARNFLSISIVVCNECYSRDEMRSRKMGINASVTANWRTIR